MATETEDGRKQPPLLVIRGDATAEEVAALVAVLQGLAAARSAAGDAPAPRSEWSSHHRKLRPPLAPGRGGWRSSALPR